MQQMSSKNKKLVGISKDNYTRPLVTKTDMVTHEQLEEMFDDYQEMNIEDIPVGAHVRYFIINDKGQEKFRPGGKLINKSGMPVYVVLTNGKVSWSVQTNNAKFYKKMTLDELKDEYEDDIEKMKREYDAKIKEMKTYTRKLLNIMQQNGIDITKIE